MDVNGEAYDLTLTKVDTALGYTLSGASTHEAGLATVIEISPLTFSVILGNRSFTVRLMENGRTATALLNGRRYDLAVSDARDRRVASNSSRHGPLEIRSQMPGKVIRLLVAPDQQVEAGDGLVVVEAMKMQNEMKAPKAGVVKRISAAEGAIVSAGEVLIVIE